MNVYKLLFPTYVAYIVQCFPFCRSGGARRRRRRAGGAARPFRPVMVRLIQVTVPESAGGASAREDAASHLAAETLIEVLMDTDHVHCLADYAGRSCRMLSFKTPDKHVGGVLRRLEGLGVGVSFGTIDVLSLLSTQPRISTYAQDADPRRRRYQWSERLSMTEVYEAIDSQSHLTFNFVAMTIAAALIASIGLVTDSSTTVVASMLVSPLMGPILCLTFGIFTRAQEMIWRGLRNELWGLFITLSIGLAVGAILSPFYGAGGVDASWARTDLRSEEMESRGNPWTLLTGFAIAVPSGVGVSLAITGGGINALVGVAISAALLPPISNCGICLALGAYYRAAGRDPMEGDHFLALGGVSLLLFLVNFVTILLVGLLMFRLKNVEPLRERTREWMGGMGVNQNLLSSSFRPARMPAAGADAASPMHLLPAAPS